MPTVTPSAARAPSAAGPSAQTSKACQVSSNAQLYRQGPELADASRYADVPLDGLDPLARHLVIQDMRDNVGRYPLARAALMHAHARDSDRPRGVADRQAQVRVVGLLVLAVLRLERNLAELGEDVERYCLRVSCA